MLKRIADTLSRITVRLAAWKGQRDLLLLQLFEAKQRAQEAAEGMNLCEKVRLLLQKTSDYARQQTKAQIENIVTAALTTVFNKDYTFSLELSVKSNRVECAYFLESAGIKNQLKPPDFDRGGGITDVISLALRLAIVELAGIKGPLLLDEIGKHVSSEYAPSVAFFLKEYSERFSRQIILITHCEPLAAAGDLSLKVTQKNGKSEVVAI